MNRSFSPSDSVPIVANGLTLDYFFDELNSAGSQTFSDIDFDSQYYMYYETNDIKQSSLTDLSFQYKALHLNTTACQVNLISLNFFCVAWLTLDIFLDFILLCETFLNEKNSHLYQLPGYKVIQMCRKEGTRGGVTTYIRDKLKYKIKR